MLYSNKDAADDYEVRMLKKALQKRTVDNWHKQAVSEIQNGPKKGKWKTYVYVNGKRKEIIRKTEEEIYTVLFDIYLEEQKKNVTFEEVFQMLCMHKSEHLGRSEQTVYIDQKRFECINISIRNKVISEITAEEIQGWVIKEYLKTVPKPDALRKMFQLLSQVFEYGIEKDLCVRNPMIHVKARDYLGKCSTERKTEEEREFSEEELEDILRETQKDQKNVHALMIRTAMETGLRAGEIAALHKDDIKGDYIHVHRQQIRTKDEAGCEKLFEVGYTKDERTHPSDGRRVPITPACREALDLALELPGESEYLFHDADGQMAKKVSYEQYLNRLCTRLGTKAKHNHAFRLAFNSRMIRLGISSADRALILGHDVSTNERIYSITDKRRLSNIRDLLAV